MRIGRLSARSELAESIFIVSWQCLSAMSVAAPRQEVKLPRGGFRSSPNRITQVACCAGVGQSWRRTIRAGVGMLLVTGGAGFIGSNVVAALNDVSRTDVVVCDLLGHDGKWRNLAKRQLADIVPPAELANWLTGRRLDAVIHLGAISETTATDGDLVIETNFRCSMRLLDWCTANAVPLIYASSAATYGDGTQGFHDDPSLPALKQLRPMNLYGWSKH